jgi:cell division protein ZapB
MSYSPLPEGVEIMDSELFDTLEQKIDVLLEVYGALKQENARMREEIHHLREDRDRIRARVDDIIRKMEGI